MNKAQKFVDARAACIMATRLFEDADKTWSKLLPNLPNARYLPLGKGDTDSPLRKAYENLAQCREIFHVANGDIRKASLNARYEHGFGRHADVIEV